MTDRSERDCDRCGLTIDLTQKGTDDNWKSCAGVEVDNDPDTGETLKRSFMVLHLCPECWQRAIGPGLR